jgi:hypothetical protein
VPEVNIGTALCHNFVVHLNLGASCKCRRGVQTTSLSGIDMSETISHFVEYSCSY